MDFQMRGIDIIRARSLNVKSTIPAAIAIGLALHNESVYLANLSFANLRLVGCKLNHEI